MQATKLKGELEQLINTFGDREVFICDWEEDDFIFIDAIGPINEWVDSRRKNQTMFVINL